MAYLSTPFEHDIFVSYAHGLADRRGVKRLNGHAEEVLREIEGAHPGSEQVTQYLFRAITEIDAQGRGIRRPQRLSELVGAAGGDQTALERVIDRFSKPDCGFLVRSPGDDPIIDIGHEALVRCWRRFDDPTVESLTGRPKGWLRREREDGQIWQALTVTIEHEFARRTSIFRFQWKRKILSLLESRQKWFDNLPRPKWADRCGGKWNLMREIMELTARLKRSRRFTARVSLLGAAGYSMLIPVAILLNTTKEESSIFTGDLILSGLASIVVSLCLLVGPIAYVVSHLRLVRSYNRCFALDEIKSPD